MTRTRYCLLCLSKSTIVLVKDLSKTEFVAVPIRYWWFQDISRRARQVAWQMPTALARILHQSIIDGGLLRGYVRYGILPTFAAIVAEAPLPPRRIFGSLRCRHSRRWGRLVAAAQSNQDLLKDCFGGAMAAKMKHHSPARHTYPRGNL